MNMQLCLTLIGLYLGGILLFLSAACMIHATDSGRALQFTRASISRFIREWMAHALLLLMLPFGISRPRAPIASPNGTDQRVPVILVPGFLMNRSSMSLLSTYLKRRGWRWVWSINNPRDTPIPVMARELGLRIDQLLKVSGAKEVDVVAHSMGGIITAWYAQNLNDCRIRHLITLGTPWKGTRMHIWGPGRETLDLAPNSEVIRQAQNPPMKVTAIWSRVDQLLVPEECARCDGHENLELEQCGHMEMLLSARVFRRVREILVPSSEPSLP